MRVCSAPAVVEDDGLALMTMDIFAGCGGLSEGLHRAGAARTKWAIEYEQPAAEAFKLNNPNATTWCCNCNVLLAAAMSKAGAADFCDASDEVRCSRHGNPCKILLQLRCSVCMHCCLREWSGQCKGTLVRGPIHSTWAVARLIDNRFSSATMAVHKWIFCK